jgi:hypothetical protein
LDSIFFSGDRNVLLLLKDFQTRFLACVRIVN